ncbi:hypothetical protein [Kaistella faecalis]|uniref:hypothetical protein n=1 Tax=Kaistella faecalis TaxID=2852098 RepID=UPI001C4665CB|nr:hypothetical protein [Chryseobacterium faecale]UFK96664.1 hypothetical protein LL667_06690 [Chryseobacterium faecale]
MIHDKDYIIRIVKQFSEFLSKMILGGKNEGDLSELDRVFDTNMRDTFKMSFEELALKSSAEMIDLVGTKDTAHHIPYFELLGHLFYFKNKENPSPDYASKAKAFYEIYLQKSGIFSMQIVSRINELKA